MSSQWIIYMGYLLLTFDLLLKPVSFKKPYIKVPRLKNTISIKKLSNLNIDK